MNVQLIRELNSRLPSQSSLALEHGNQGDVFSTWLTNQMTGNLDWNRQSALQQRDFDFQRQMSNTSYQRAVADMSKAGLNPYLAYAQGGASVGSGSSASSSRSGQGFSSLLGGFASLVGKAMSGAFGAYQTALKLEHQEDMLHERLAYQTALQTAKNTYSIDKQYFDKHGELSGSVSTWKRPK